MYSKAKEKFCPPPDGNLFMACEAIVHSSFALPPAGFTIRNCRPDELTLWKGMHFDTDDERCTNIPYMNAYFDRVYRPFGDLFYRSCRFICDGERPIGTCMRWRAYGRVNTVHWFKVQREYEGQGLGRALLSDVMQNVAESDMPVCLHTQPSSYRAIGLYADFGFKLVTNERIGDRHNDLDAALPYLRAIMPKSIYARLQFCKAPDALIDAVESREAEF